MTRKTFAVLMLGNIPERIFRDKDAAEAFVDDHDRLPAEGASIVWPIRLHEEDSP